MKLMMEDLTKSWGYKYSYTFKCRENTENPEKLRGSIKAKGTKKQISYKGKAEDVYYYISFINEKYYWLYENMTNRKFRATFRFELTNLKIEDEENKDEDTEFKEWHVLLNPGEH